MRSCVPILGGVAWAVSAALHAAEPTANVVEYYNSVTKHYFITEAPEDIQAIDSGAAGPGWSKTGATFGAFKNSSDSSSAIPVCRFYAPGPNSHFYAAGQTECDLVKTFAGWTYERVTFYIEPPRSGTCADGTAPIYRLYNNGFVRNDSNHRYTPDATVYWRMGTQGYAREGVTMCAPLSSVQKDADAVRLLHQATFGPTESELTRVRSLGLARWIDDQFGKPASQYANYAFTPLNVNAGCPQDGTGKRDPVCVRDNYTLFPMQREFFTQALKGEDQLRQRVAFALSQILVTSGVDTSLNYGMARYQQLLRDLAFDNYETILYKVTLSPLMGRYLDMVDNDKPSGDAQPNENYARELLQLFSLGVAELKDDGTLLTDANGRPIATYDQDEIEGFAHVFTGWTYPTQPGAAARRHNPGYFIGDMLAVADNHDNSAQPLLDGTTKPAGLSAPDALTFAIRTVFMHPNVPPFVSKQLIQKLVTGDPSPEYVARVVKVFKDNGNGVRGDMRAVVRAILTDPEARGYGKYDTTYGHLKEPVRWTTAVLRAFNGETDGIYPRNVTGSMGQPLYYSPSVFNYYPPDHVIPGSSTLAPEFAIQNTSTTLARTNLASALVLGGSIAPDANVAGSTGTRLDLSAYAALANDPAALVNKLDALLTAGRLSDAAKTSIITAVNAVPASDTLTRARTAAYLVVSSSQYNVER